jgi:hypothetical protein
MKIANEGTITLIGRDRPGECFLEAVGISTLANAIGEKAVGKITKVALKKVAAKAVPIAGWALAGWDFAVCMGWF